MHMNRKETTVFTNGCFDLFHYGHLYILKEARKLADTLIVGINTDESVERLKGKGRPIYPLLHRQQILTSLIYVDGVIAFEEDTPIEIIKRMKPDFLVKGGDWKKENIVGADFVESYGGTVSTIKLFPGISTSRILECIKEQSTG